MNQQFKKGDPIYYFDNDLSGWPGVVRGIKKRVKVHINHYDGDKTLWVSPGNLQHQICATRETQP